MKKIFFSNLLALSTLVVGACSQESTTVQRENAAQKAVVADSSATQQMAYICPMECEGSANMKPGKCPVCAMDLTKNPEYTTTAR